MSNFSGGHYRPRFIIIRTCRICGDEFETTRKDARYCSPKCRKVSSRVDLGDMDLQTYKPRPKPR